MIGVIADDLTGAAEIGAVGVRHGLRAEVVIAGEPSGTAELVCLDTDSRLCSASEAANRAAAAAKLLQSCGAQWIYKKTDSVLRGNVTPEIEAIVRKLELSGALLVPANPSLGRTIVNGQYFVRGKLIHETEFARDPKHPRSSPNVIELLDDSSWLPISVGKTGEVLPDSGIVAGEVASSDDVRKWAVRWNDNWLAAGGAEFFSAMLQARDSERRVTRAPESADAGSFRTRLTRSSGKELFVCGSASESAREFVETSRERGVPVISLPDKLAHHREFSSKAVLALAETAAAAFGSHRRVILSVGLPFVEDRLLAASLSTHIVRVAEAVLCRGGVGHVFIEGGATAVELVRRMSWERLGVLRELSPGVATLAVEGKTSLLLTIKPGSYVWPDAVRNAI